MEIICTPNIRVHADNAASRRHWLLAAKCGGNESKYGSRKEEAKWETPRMSARKLIRFMLLGIPLAKPVPTTVISTAKEGAVE